MDLNRFRTHIERELISDIASLNLISLHHARWYSIYSVVLDLVWHNFGEQIKFDSFKQTNL